MSFVPPLPMDIRHQILQLFNIHSISATLYGTTSVLKEYRAVCPPHWCVGGQFWTTSLPFFAVRSNKCPFIHEKYFYLFLNCMKFNSMLLNWMQFIHYKFIFSQTIFWKPTTYQTTYDIALFEYGTEKVEKTLSFCFYGNVCSNEMRYNIGRGLMYKDTLARISATMKTKQVSPITLENLPRSSEKCC